MPEKMTLRQRRALLGAGLFSAGVGLMGPMTAAAGAVAWLCPLAALPGGLLLCRLWRGARRPGRAGKALILVWTTLLLWSAAGEGAARLLRGTEAGGNRWAALLLLLALTLYLTRRETVLGRVGVIFAGAVGVVLAGSLLLSLSALRWDNLMPTGRESLGGTAVGTGWALSLAGYGAPGLLLGREEEKGGGGRLCFGWAAALAGLLLAVMGSFGPALILRMDRPFFYLLEGVGVPGAFRRGEALLMALSSLGDMALLGLLALSGGLAWEGLGGRGRWVPAAAGFALAAFLPAGPGEEILLWGGLAAGWLLPLLMRGSKEPTSCAETGPKTADIGGKNFPQKS